ncbi:MAG TPA: FGGY family carbohydrate kinase [Gaiellaceae bacterium]|nr:FGGY family carbohydrate kinase [Gaiellaceae bacterium]
MTGPSVLGIDVGTSATKAVLAAPDGTVLRQARRAHGLSLPRPGWVEHDAEAVWWEETRSLCAELAPGAPGLAAVCVSGIGPCLLPCDGALRPLRPAILYGVDTRAEAEIAELEERYGAGAILARGGSALSSQAVGPKLLWLRRHEPEVWERTASWHTAASFVAARLCGEVALDRHSASQCDPLWDRAAGGWAEDWAAEIAPGVPLPRLVRPGEPVGAVTAEASAATGLPAGLPVVSGTVDAWAEAFGAGVRRPGELMLMYGSTMFVVQVVAEPRPDPLLWLTEGVEPGLPTLAAGMSTSGSLTEWLRELVGGPPWEELLAEAAAVPPGSRGLLVLPYFAGERTPVYDPDARGVVAGLTLAHGRGELLRAVYESIGCGVRQILALLAAAAAPAARVVAVGGGVQGDLWPQIVSDVSGRAQEVPRETVGASYGSALLAAIGAGLVPPETDWARVDRVVEPRAETGPLYDALFERYEQLYPATAAIVHGLAAAGG